MKILKILRLLCLLVIFGMTSYISYQICRWEVGVIFTASFALCYLYIIEFEYNKFHKENNND